MVISQPRVKISASSSAHTPPCPPLRLEKQCSQFRIRRRLKDIPIKEEEEEEDAPRSNNRSSEAATGASFTLGVSAGRSLDVALSREERMVGTVSYCRKIFPLSNYIHTTNYRRPRNLESRPSKNTRYWAELWNNEKGLCCGMWKSTNKVPRERNEVPDQNLPNPISPLCMHAFIFISP